MGRRVENDRADALCGSHKIKLREGIVALICSQNHFSYFVQPSQLEEQPLFFIGLKRIYTFAIPSLEPRQPNHFITTWSSHLLDQFK